MSAPRRRPRRATPFALRPIGRIASDLRSIADAPMQGSEGAPDAWLEVEASFADGPIPATR